MSIFDFADQFQIDSPWTNWIKPTNKVLGILSKKTTNDCEQDKITVLNILKSIKGAKNYTNKLSKYKNLFNEKKINILYEGDSWLDYGPAIPTDLFNIDLKNRIIDYYNKNYKKHVTHLDIAKFGDVTGYMTMSDYKNDAELNNLNAFYNEKIKRKELEKVYKPFLKTIIDQYSIDIIVFSGGGNDILASYLKDILKNGVLDRITFSDIRNFPDSGRFYDYYEMIIKPNEKKVDYDDIGKFCIANQDKFDLDQIFERCADINTLNIKLQNVKNNYLKVVDFVKNSKNPHTSIIGHTYDYAVLRENASLGIGANRPHKTKPEQNKFLGSSIGPWIKPYFDAKKIHSRTIRALVLIYMINRFKSVLQEVKDYAISKNVNFDFVDFHRTCFESNYMTDEIHPSTIGSKYLFNQFNKKMLPTFLDVVSKKKIDVFKKGIKKYI